MSLDVYLTDPTATYPHSSNLHSSNITHNLNKMASEAGIYKVLWRPEELQPTKEPTKAKYITAAIEKGLNDMKERPSYYKQFNSPNGWGTYKDFIPWIEEYLEALKKYPEALVTTSR